MNESADLHIGRVVTKETEQNYLEGNPLDRVKMHCLHGINLFNPCVKCEEHFTNRILGFYSRKEPT